MATCSFPARLRSPATRDFKQTTSRILVAYRFKCVSHARWKIGTTLRTLTGQVSNDRCDIVGLLRGLVRNRGRTHMHLHYLESVDHLLRPDKTISAIRNSYSGYSIPYQIVIVIAVPAMGARQLERMLYFLPSSASVRVRPRIAALAVAYWMAKLVSVIESLWKIAR